MRAVHIRSDNRTTGTDGLMGKRRTGLTAFDAILNPSR